MAVKDMRVAPNQFVPEKDVTRKTEDGREIVVARKGIPMSRSLALRHGLIKDATEEKASEPASNKATAPSSDKGGKK